MPSKPAEAPLVLVTPSLARTLRLSTSLSWPLTTNCTLPVLVVLPVGCTLPLAACTVLVKVYGAMVVALLPPRLSTLLADMVSLEVPPCRVIISTCSMGLTVWLPVVDSRLSVVPAASLRLSMPVPPLMMPPAANVACKLVLPTVMVSLLPKASRAPAV